MYRIMYDKSGVRTEVPVSALHTAAGDVMMTTYVRTSEQFRCYIWI